MSETTGKYRGTTAYMLVYGELVAAARHRGFTTYQAIAQLMGLPMSGSYMGSQVGTILGEISEDEVAAGRPMLSAVAVGVSGRLGSGFATLAKQLGRLDEGSAEDELRFCESEREAVYETWKPVYRTK